jgi:hypothetical protein
VCKYRAIESKISSSVLVHAEGRGFHVTPTPASWPYQIELFVSILTCRLLRRGIFTSQADLDAELLAFIERDNPTAKPFAWTYQAKPLKA